MIACAVLIAATAAVRAAPDGGNIIEDVRFRSITVEHGLSQPTVRTMLQDRRGFVWIGTLDGLNRSDGARIRVFRTLPNQPNSLSDNHVSSLVEDDAGHIWIGTAGATASNSNTSPTAATASTAASPATA